MFIIILLFLVRNQSRSTQYRIIVINKVGRTAMEWWQRVAWLFVLNTVHFRIAGNYRYQWPEVKPPWNSPTRESSVDLHAWNPPTWQREKQNDEIRVRPMEYLKNQTESTSEMEGGRYDAEIKTSGMWPTPCQQELARRLISSQPTMRGSTGHPPGVGGGGGYIRGRARSSGREESSAPYREKRWQHAPQHAGSVRSAADVLDWAFRVIVSIDIYCLIKE